MKENHLQIYENLEQNICIFCYSNYILDYKQDNYILGYHSINKVLFCTNCKNIYGCDYNCDCNESMIVDANDVPSTIKCKTLNINSFWINTKKYILSDKPTDNKIYLLEHENIMNYDKLTFHKILKNISLYDDMAELSHFEINLFDLDKLNNKIDTILNFS